MKYCEDDLPVKIVFANDLLKFFGDALVAMLNEENPLPYHLLCEKCLRNVLS